MTLYEILGVSPKATLAQIKQVYRVKARLCHPDLHSDDSGAADRFRILNEAYEVLSDRRKRWQYDRGFDPIESVSDLFGRHSYGLRTVATMLPSAPAAYQPGVDMMVKVEVPIKTLRNGGRIEIRFSVRKEERVLSLEVPPGGTGDIRWMKQHGLGYPGRNSGEPGDLLVCLVPKGDGR